MPSGTAGGLPDNEFFGRREPLLYHPDHVDAWGKGLDIQGIARKAPLQDRVSEQVKDLYRFGQGIVGVDLDCGSRGGVWMDAQLEFRGNRGFSCFLGGQGHRPQ